jgi:hypothetical protein
MLQATSEEPLEALLQHCQGVQLPCLPTPRSAANQQQGQAETTTGANSSGSNALLQELYKHKLEALLKEHNTTLLRCKACQQLFSAASHHKLQCPAIAGSATERWVRGGDRGCLRLWHTNTGKAALHAL